MLSGSLAVFIMFSASAACAAPIQWTTGGGGNGHWYEIVNVNRATHALGVATAATYSVTVGGVSSTGKLVSIQSQAEQNFVYNMVTAFKNGGGTFVSAYIMTSGFYNSGAATYKWTDSVDPTNPNISYTNWAPGRPSSNAPILAMGHVNGRWYDGSQSSSHGYALIVEYLNPAGAPVPIPASMPLMAGGLGILALYARKRKNKA